MKKKFFRKEVDSLEVEIKHVKRESYKINKRHQQIDEKFSDLEGETMENYYRRFFFTKCETCEYKT